MGDGSIIIDSKFNNDGLKSGLKNIGSIASTALKGVAVASGAIATAMTGIIIASVNARGELEQQIGGIKTLFVNELGDASETVIKNANNAYKTAGMSAIEYMSTATSFSASLLQSLGKDTKKAAEVTDMAIVDMSDNANKMGTSMESIQMAYQGFAKQNYTMLDNLKLGYGGTKTEMERLLSDAQKISGIKYDINNLSDVYNAIHVIQTELGITGTTAKEASDTLQGSFSSMQASWSNFLSGSGDLGQVVDTATDVVKNVVRIVKEAVPQMMKSIAESLPEILELGGEILNELINGIIEYLPNLMSSSVQILNSLVQGILLYLPQILEAGIKIISELALGIAQMLPTLIPQAVNCIITLVMGLLDNIDLIIDAAISLIMGLADGLIEALPLLIEKTPIIIDKLLDALIRNLPKISKASWELIVKLANGIINYLPTLGSATLKIINTIGNYLLKLPALAIQWGKDMIQGIIDGIKSMLGNVANIANNVAQTIAQFLHFSRPDKGPLRDYETWMPDMIKGLTNSVYDNIPQLYKASKILSEKIESGLNLDNVYSKLSSAVNFETQKLSANLSTSANINRAITTNINVTGDTYMDSTKVGRMVAPTVSKTIRTGGIK